MKLITIFYIINATLLLLHEIESAYEREWELLKLPGKITGFLLIHIPIILVILIGLLEIEKTTLIGAIIGIIMGIGGIIPFIVHKVIVRRKEHFSSICSNILIYLNIISGIGTIILSMSFFA
ncbi:hypothetical protein JW796_03590 [Candidatus Dojkabacteria bacterium]|nr:hypothetical protein [Candidatus Dojkabacteria bacterium]